MRGIYKLSKTRIEKLIAERRVGDDCDGGNLYFVVRPKGTGHSWNFKWWNGATKKTETIGLGPYHTLDLDLARAKAQACRLLLLEGKNPRQERDAQRHRAAAAAGRAVTVAQTIDEWAELRLRVKTEENPRGITKESRDNVLRKVGRIKDTIGSMPIRDVTRDVLAKEGGLRELADESGFKVEAIRREVARVFKYAIAHRYHDGPNPASKEEMQYLLPEYQHQKKHRVMLPYKDVPRLLAVLRGLTVSAGGNRGFGNPWGSRPLASFIVELAILTGARVGEVRVTQWQDLDFKEMIWTTRAEDHKTGKIVGAQFRPITSAMAGVFDQIRKRVETGAECFLFPSSNGRGCLERSSAWNWMNKTLRPKWDGAKFDLHGFRSTLNAWSMSAGYPEYLWDFQVFHKVGNSVKQAYTHDPQFEPRRKMMEVWNNFCNEPKGDNVIAIRTAL
jgi:integrase